MKKRFQKWLSFLFALMFIVLSIPFTASANDLTMGAIETTDVVDDLERMGVDITEYPKNVEMDHCRMLTFLEYGFDYYVNTSDYGLYVYMYNPSGRVIDVNGKNYIQMQTKRVNNEVSSGWKKYALEFCSYSTTQGFEHVFYKFKVKDVSGFRDNLSVDFRHYDISGVELHFSGKRNATDFAVGGGYSFTGFMPYRDQGRTVNNSLYMYVRPRETVELELHPVSWKTKTSDKGVGYQYEVFSVYFSVPNDIIRDYGDKNNVTKGLVEIDGTFEEYKINGVVTPYSNVYNTIKADLGKKDTDENNLTWGLATEAPQIMAFYYGSKAFNCSWVDLVPLYNPDLISRICTVLDYNGGEFEGISSLEFEEQLFELMVSREDGMLPVLNYVDEGCTKGYQPYNVTSKDDLADSIATYASNPSNNKFKAWFKGESNLYLEDESYDAIQGIQAINTWEVMKDSLYLSSAAIAEKFYMQESEADEFKRFVVSEAAKDRTTYILRYAVRDYYCEDVYVRLDGLEKNYRWGDGNYYFEKTVFFNFDILSLTWEDQYQKRSVIPVVASPVNNVGSITPPRNPSIIGSIIDKVEDGVDKVKETKDWHLQLKPWLLLIGGLIVAALVCWILSKFTWLGKALTAPFRWIGKKRSEKKENEREKARSLREEEKHRWAQEDRSEKQIQKQFEHIRSESPAKSEKGSSNAGGLNSPDREKLEKPKK